MEGFEFSAVYRLTDAAQSSETEYAIVTLAGESGEFFTVRQRTGGTGAIAYAYKDAPEGLRFTGKAAVKMADTNWHKLSISAGKYKEDESKAYMDAWMDGVHVNGFPWSAGAATTFWKEGLMGTEGQYNQILVGKKLDSANYANPLENFPGEFQYIKFSKAADASAEAAQNTVEEKYTDALAALLGECEVLTEEAYTAESWAPFAAALTAAEAVEANKEWAIINATDALAAAKAALVETEEPGPGPQPVEPQKAGIKMGAAESQELNGESQTLKGWAGYAVDGDNNTFWHSNYNGSADVKPNIAGGERSSYFIALNEAADVTKVTYLPRQAQAANVNGTILKCEVYVTTDALEGMPSLAEVTDVATAGTKNTEALNVFKAEGVTWKKVAITTFDAGNWANDSAEKEIVFPAVEKGVTGIQVKVLNSGVATNDSRVDTFISGAEFNVYAQPAEEEDPEVVKAAQNELKAAITADIEAKAATNNQTEDGTKVYTTASWNRFKAAYDAAKELADKENLTDVTSAELNAAKEALETAAAGLEKYVPEKKEIPVNPDVTVKAPTAGQAVPTDQAKLDETQEDYMEVTDTTWTPASGTVSQYEDYAVSVTLTAKEGYYFGENAAAVLRTSEANVLTGATVSVNEDGSAMTINYTFKGEELAGPTDLDKAKEAVNNALNAADAIYAAGQKDYTDATWKVFADAYKAAKEAPADADAAKLNALAKSLNAAREKLAKKETGHKMGSWDRKKSTKKSTVLTRTCTNPDCTCKGSYKEQVTIPKTINLGSSETIEIKGSNPKLKITMETKVKKTPIITLKGKKKKRKYIAYDAKKRRIKTGIPTGKFEKSVYFRVDAGDGTRPEKVKVKLKVPAPRKKTDIVIKKTKVQNGAYYRYDFTYKHAVLQASKITVRIKNRNNKNTNSVLNRALGKPNADRYIHLSKDAIKGLKNKVEFQITVTYGKNKSGTLKYTVK